MVEEFDESWTVRVTAADFAAGFASIRVEDTGMNLPGHPWHLAAVHAVLPRTFIKVRVSTEKGAILGGTLPQSIDGLRARLPSSWDGKVVFENDPLDPPCDHFATFIRRSGTCE